MVVIPFYRIKDLSKGYFLSSNTAFFYRYADSSFRKDGCGLWFYNLRIFDYFAVKVGDIWLNWDNAVECIYDFVKARHIYKDGEEEIFLPEDEEAFVLKVKSKKKTWKCMLEIGFNVRYKDEWNVDRKYSIIKLDENTFELFVEKIGKFYLKFDRPAKLLKTEYRVHSPGGGGPYRIFVVQIEVRGDSFTFVLSRKRDSIRFSELERLEREKRSYYMKIIEKTVGKIKFENKKLEELAKVAVLNMLFLEKKKDNKYFIFAGYPWFTEMWTRDTIYILYAWTLLGRLDIVDRVLDNLIVLGKIVNWISVDGKVDFNTLDGKLLFIYLLERLAEISAEKTFLIGGYTGRRYLEIISKLIERVREEFDKDNDGLLETDEYPKSKTWMDSIKRIGKNVEINALWIKVLERYNELARKLNLSIKPYNIEKLKKKFIEIFYDKFSECLVDNETKRKLTPNVLIPILLGVVDYHIAERTMRKVEERLLFPYGIATLDKFDVSFTPSAYHSGSIWLLTTFWYMAAKEVIGENAWWLIDKIYELVHKEVIAAFPECLDAATGEIIGCQLQGWSAAWFIIWLFEYLMPLEDKKITIRKLTPFGKIEKEKVKLEI